MRDQPSLDGVVSGAWRSFERTGRRGGGVVRGSRQRRNPLQEGWSIPRWAIVAFMVVDLRFYMLAAIAYGERDEQS